MLILGHVLGSVSLDQMKYAGLVELLEMLDLFSVTS